MKFITPLWLNIPVLRENVWFDVRDLFREGTNTIHIRARTSKYNDPRIGPFAASAKLLQPVVLIGAFRVEGDGRLTSWTDTIDLNTPWEEQGLPHIAGVGVYRRRVWWDGHGPLILHLPQCTDAVEVRINGARCGVQVWPPYVFDLTAPLHEGDNDLEIRVHNTLGTIITETYAGSRPSEPPISGLLAAPQLLGV